MLFRHIIGYTPSLIIPALTAFLAVFAYTHLLSPTEYGHYALALNSMNLLNAIFFFWLQVSLPRLMPQAIKEKRDTAFRTTAYAAYASVGAVVIIIGVPFAFFFPFGEFREVAITAIPLALARSVLNLNQSFHRSYLDFGRYNIIECGQAIIGLVVGLALVSLTNLHSAGANVGMIVGMACMLFVDFKTIMKTKWSDFDPEALKEIIRFGAPLVGSFGLGFLISSADRYLIGYFHGAAQIGIYAAGYTLVDRVITMLFMAVATPSFPLAVQRLEQEGVEAAQHQMQRNGIAVLFLILPACAGLLLANEQLVSVLIGGEFRDGALKVVPWIVAASALNGLSTHYLCHTLHLAKKPHLLFWIQIPVAAINLLLNLTLIPRFGYMGAAYATFASYSVLLVMNIWMGFKVFPFPFPFKELAQISASVGLMVLVVSMFDFPVNALGLVEKIAAGCVVYLLALILFDIMDVRAKIYAYGFKMINKPSAHG
jgi:O-antigen/teichoic acid export membrane protein